MSITQAATRAVLAARMGEPPSQIQQNLDGDRFGARYLEVDGQRIWRGVPDAVWEAGRRHTLEQFPEALLRGFDARSMLAAFDREGVARAALFPTVGLWLFAVEGLSPDLTAALVRAYNRWLRDFVAAAPDRLVPVATLARHDAAEMLSEARRAARWGWRAVTLRPNPMGGRTIGHPDFDPVWAFCEEAGLVVCLHEGAHACCETAGQWRLQTRFAQFVSSHPMEQQLAFLSLLEAGVFERHPRLRVAFMESGCGWLPYWLERLDRAFDDPRQDTRSVISTRPSEVFKRQCWIGAEPDEVGLGLAAQFVGTDRLIWGSDFPHIDHTLDVARDRAAFTDGLSAEAAAAIMGANGRRMFGLD